VDFHQIWQTGDAIEDDLEATFLNLVKVKVKQSLYTPWRRLEGEEL
jgi:hypothetical protein